MSSSPIQRRVARLQGNIRVNKGQDRMKLPKGGGRIAKELRARGLKYTEIAMVLGVSAETARRACVGKS